MATKQKHRLEHLSGNWTVAEIVVRYKPKIVDPLTITSSDDMYKLIMRLWDKEKIHLQEQFVAFFFNTANTLIGYRVISTGSIRSCIVDIKLLISLALHCLAENVILAHNHPSGNLEASLADKLLTEKIKQALQLIDVKLLDHFIIAEQSYVSFAEKRLL